MFQVSLMNGLSHSSRKVMFSSQETPKTSPALVRGIEMRLMPSPLHGIHIKSGLVTGFFPVVAHAGFPIEVVHFIMGNDMAGSKVFPVPEVVSPILHSEYDCRAKHHPGAMVAIALT